MLVLCMWHCAVHGFERERQSLAPHWGHLHKLGNDKLQPARLKKLLNHYCHSHQLRGAYVFMHVCVFLCSTSFVAWWMCSTISGTLVVCSLSDSKPSWLHGHETLFSNVCLSSPCQSTGLASTLNQVPSWKAVLHHSTCATTCWSSPEASLPSSLATGSCRRYVATVLCQMASCSREGLGVDIVSIWLTEKL